jgi:hypothetical protein
VPSLLTSLRDHLVAQNLVRKPSVAGAAPPLWLAPRLGVPAPGEGGNATEVGSDLVVGAFQTGGLAPGPYAGWRRDPFIALRFRGLNAQNIENLHLAIANELIDRRDFNLASGGSQMHVVECEMTTELQDLGSDEQGFEFETTYQFTLTRAGYVGPR